jgi:hypothetical protein
LGIFDALFGDGGEKELRSAKKKSDAALTEGYDAATGRFDEAFELFTPYAEQGQVANQRYNQLLGLGTPEERDAAQQTYLDDPAFQGMLGLESNRLLKQLNARGQTYGGTSALAGARVGLEGYGNYLNRLQGQGQQGFGATTSQANTRMNQGNLDFGFGATKAGSEINFGNSVAQAQQSGVNNLLSLVGTGAQAAAAFSDVRLKRDIQNVGHLPSGLPAYRFKYTWSDDEHQGVLAHEAAEMFPDAVSRHESGFLIVDYSKVH